MVSVKFAHRVSEHPDADLSGRGIRKLILLDDREDFRFAESGNNYPCVSHIISRLKYTKIFRGL